MKQYTEQEIEFIKQNYIQLTNKELAAKLGRTKSAIFGKLYKMNLRRPAGLVREQSIRSRFPKGNIPWNKNLKGMHLSPESEFKIGHTPVNCKYDGAITIRLHRRTGKLYKFIRIKQGKWKAYHSYLWEQVNGKIPDGCIVRFKKGCDPLDVRLENLILVNRKKHLRMNANYEKSIKSMNQYWQNGGEGHLNSDKFVAFTLEPFDAALRRECLNHPELIELKRNELKLRRAINNEFNNKTR